MKMITKRHSKITKTQEVEIADIKANLKEKQIPFLMRLLGDSRPRDNKRRTTINMAVAQIFGPKSFLEKPGSKNLLEDFSFNDMLQDEKDLKVELKRVKAKKMKEKRDAAKKAKKEAKKLRKEAEAAKGKNGAGKGSITLFELSKHNTEADAWIAIEGKVFDITEYAKKHPGGNIILSEAGKDATATFST